MIRAVLAGEKGAPRDIVLLNAGAAIYVGGKAETLKEGIDGGGGVGGLGPGAGGAGEAGQDVERTGVTGRQEAGVSGAGTAGAADGCCGAIWSRSFRASG